MLLIFTPLPQLVAKFSVGSTFEYALYRPVRASSEDTEVYRQRDQYQSVADHR